VGSNKLHRGHRAVGSIITNPRSIEWKKMNHMPTRIKSTDTRNVKTQYTTKANETRLTLSGSEVITIGLPPFHVPLAMRVSRFQFVAPFDRKEGGGFGAGPPFPSTFFMGRTFVDAKATGVK
jgi:hypothetical protein